MRTKEFKLYLTDYEPMQNINVIKLYITDYQQMPN